MTAVTTSGSADARNMPLKAIDLIWNITLVCPWDCAICCVDAVHVTKHAGMLELRSKSLSQSVSLPYLKENGSIYDQAMSYRQGQGLELDLAGKLRILDNIEGYKVKIDFSGGDPLSAAENLQVMRIAAERFGRNSVTLTATGAGLARCIPEELASLVGELNFTYDNILSDAQHNRPAGYAEGNLKKAARFAAANVLTRAECPLTVENMDEHRLRRLYLNLHEAGIHKLLLMRLFPVGRGAFQSAQIPTAEQYRQAITVLREMEAAYHVPQVKLQCALKFFDDQTLTDNPCDLVRESFGLMSDGTLLTSPWAVGPAGRPLGDEWVLGNLASTPLSIILNSEKAQHYLQHTDDNFGHCKIFAYMNSKRTESLNRMFDKADPLYLQMT